MKKRIIAGLLAAASLLSMTACSGNATTDSGASTEAPQTSSPATTEDDEKENPVSIGDISIDAGDEVEPATLMYLSNYDLRTAGDIKPAYKYFQENYGCDIDVTIVSSLQIQEKLTTAISSGTSPDLVDYQTNTFPLMMSKNMYTPLDDYMDLSAPQWSGLEEYVEKYKWNGKNYYYPWAYNATYYFLIYNRGLFQQLAIDDPKELYDKGEWTWDTFKECCRKFIASEDGRTGLYGQVGTAFIDTTGTPLISIDESGNITNNLVNADVERAATFMQELKTEGIAKYAEGGFNDVSEEPIKEGLTAFQSMGEWIISNYSRAMTKDDTLDIFFVPFPRDPNADEHYMGMSTFGYLVPAGSKYAQQACVFINCCRLSVMDDDLRETTKASIMKNKKYTDEQYEFIMEFHDPTKFNCVVDEPYGLDDTTSSIIKDILNNVIFDTGNETYAGLSWTQMRDANSGAIQAQVDVYNQLIADGNS